MSYVYIRANSKCTPVTFAGFMQYFTSEFTVIGWRAAQHRNNPSPYTTVKQNIRSTHRKPPQCLHEKALHSFATSSSSSLLEVNCQIVSRPKPKYAQQSIVAFQSPAGPFQHHQGNGLSEGAQNSFSTVPARGTNIASPPFTSLTDKPVSFINQSQGPAVSMTDDHAKRCEW